MRTTIEMNDGLHEHMRRQAQRENISLARLLGRLVEQAANAAAQDNLLSQRSGRFTVIAGGAGTCTKSQKVQKVIDEEGIL